jgi:hypothetical protein
MKIPYECHAMHTDALCYRASNATCWTNDGHGACGASHELNHAPTPPPPVGFGRCSCATPRGLSDSSRSVALKKNHDVRPRRCVAIHLVFALTLLHELRQQVTNCWLRKAPHSSVFLDRRESHAVSSRFHVCSHRPLRRLLSCHRGQPCGQSNMRFHSARAYAGQGCLVALEVRFFFLPPIL